MSPLSGDHKDESFFSRLKIIKSQTFIFIFKLMVLNIPLLIVLKLLRSNPTVQSTISETFPVYHLAKLIMTSAKILLSLIGYNATLIYDTTIYHYGVFSLQIPGGVETFIGFSCLGLGVSWVFATLIVSSPGRAIVKTIFVSVGVLIIFILNVIRMSYLTWSGRDGSIFTNKTISLFGITKLDHHDLFNIFIYIVIILLLVLWNEVYSQKKSPE